MKWIFKTLAIALMLVVSANVMAQNMKKMDKEDIMQKQGWTKISPNEVKNAVTLFNNDWMALAAGKSGDMNAMTISWGQMGELWQRPVITVYVRESRYTKTFIDRYPYFTVTAFPEQYHKALGYIGSHSGRDGDKLKVAGLTPEFTELGNPVFREANLAIECKILYISPIDTKKIDAQVLKDVYGDHDYHTMYIGEIVNVWKK